MALNSSGASLGTAKSRILEGGVLQEHVWLLFQVFFASMYSVVLFCISFVRKGRYTVQNVLQNSDKPSARRDFPVYFQEETIMLHFKR